MTHIYNLQPSTLDGTEPVFDYMKYTAFQLPESFDLRPQCPPVYDQGKEGSCTANAGVFARVMLLIQNLFPRVTEEEAVLLSRAFLYYMERDLEGNTEIDSGASMKDIGEALEKFGVCKESTMPYVEGDYQTAPTDAAKQEALAYKISGASMVQGIDGIKTALVSQNQPVLVGMTVYESMESDRVAQTGVLPMPKAWEPVLGGHAVAIVGYLPALSDGIMEKLHPFLVGEIAEKVGKSTCLKKIINKVIDILFDEKVSGYFIVRNSWGADWGDGGYFYMPYEYVKRGFANEFWMLENLAPNINSI